jgi:dTDP-4-dehydrorhamnose 3,5-epimerase-like enzyme
MKKYYVEAGINWPVNMKDLILSDKDKNALSLHKLSV